MRLVCSTLGFEGTPLERAFEHLWVVGYEAVEMVLSESASPLELLDWRSLGLLQESLDDHRMQVVLLDGWHQKLSQDGEEWLRRAKATVNAACAMGAPLAGIHLAGMGPRELESKLPKLMAHAERRDVRLVIELPATVPQALKQWLEQTDARLVGVSMDLSELDADWRVPVEVWGDRLWSLRLPLGAAASELSARVAGLKASGFDGVLALKSDAADRPPHAQAQEALRQLRPLMAALKAGD